MTTNFRYYREQYILFLFSDIFFNIDGSRKHHCNLLIAYLTYLSKQRHQSHHSENGETWRMDGKGCRLNRKIETVNKLRDKHIFEH